MLELLPQPARRAAPPGHHPGPGLGRPGPAGRLAGPPGQAHLRLVRRGHRLPVRVDRVGPAVRRTRTPGVPGGRRRTPSPTTSWARTTSSSTPRSGRRCCSATPARAAKDGTPGQLGALNVPTEVVSSEYLTMEGRKFSSSRAVVIYVRDFLARYDVDALRYYVAVAGPGEPGHRLHLERVPPPQQRRAGRHLGQPGQPLGVVRRAQHRLDPRARPPDRGRPGDPGAIPAGVRPGRRLAGPVPVQGRGQRGDADGRPRPTSTCPTRRRGSCASPTRSGCAPILHVVLQLVNDAKTLLTPFLPGVVGQGVRMLGGEGTWTGMPRIEEVDEDGGPSYPVITGDYDTAPAGSPGRSRRARRWPPRSRCSPSSTRRSWRRNWPGWGSRRDRARAQ